MLDDDIEEMVRELIECHLDEEARKLAVVWFDKVTMCYAAKDFRDQPSRINRAARLASRAAFLLPSPAETIEPFISICQACANFSGSRRCASLASPWMIVRILPRWIAAARRTGLSISDSRSTLINEQRSNVFLRNQPSNTSKIASNLPSGVEARRLTSASSQPRVHNASRRSRKAIARSTLESKLS